MSKGFLTKDQILSAQDKPYEDIDMSEFGWPGKVRISKISAAARDQLDIRLFGPDGKERNISNMRAETVVACLIDPESGERMFSFEEAEKLGTRSADAVDHLFKIATRLNKMFEGEKVDDEVKNLSAAPVDSSPSD